MHLAYSTPNCVLHRSVEAIPKNTIDHYNNPSIFLPRENILLVPSSCRPKILLSEW